ncbi:hypothetical protein EJ05DRAFT_510149 [Pseudovirgaria hyperparasitica]|uniref:Mitochondrial distribution and morphology protein family 31/32 n=1 Tax=Pseudovirgaria hyperparasitica TaxID=470096 RepID=A0A6A6WAW3_9PEZI|nr:uncharacterized protein EJ05DRAFT_510149 [Pseudovirgaria hyperparasitica]KAF2759319.1 hypothetical protein EJ05DRAFT_510149 [Pseudovirgaria hyperparasitica]
MSRNAGYRAGGALWRNFADLPLSRSSQLISIATRASSLLERKALPPLVQIATFRLVAHRCNTTRFRSEDSTAALATTAWRSRILTDVRQTSWQTTSSTKRWSSTDRESKDADRAGHKKTVKDTEKSKDENTEDDQSSGLLNRFPHLHRPTKEELLATATGFWQRLSLRFKWFTIRSGRPYTLDEMSGFFSWIFLGHVLWIVLGTTTFFSLAIITVNTVFAQETLARWIGGYLTQSSGIKVIFESAVVPKWKDGVISFQKVFVSRRPGQGKANVSKGSQSSAAEAALAATQREKDGVEEEEEDTNYTQFDISIDTVNVTLSFAKWFNGKGLLQDVEVRGVRGVIDRTYVRPLTEPVDPKSYRHEHNPGDFELDSFRLEDLLVTVYQPDGFRPFPVSIYSCDLPQLRKQWLFYDFMSANMMSGSYDNSLFTIHPRQTHNYTGTQLSEGRDTESGLWKKHSRVRIDGLNIDHLNRGVEGTFSWIHEGNVDIVADIMLPAEHDGSIVKVMSDFYDRMEASVTSNGHRFIAPNPQDASGHLAAQTDEPTLKTSDDDDDKRFIVMDLRVHLNDVRAAVPLFTNDISYVNNALIRPIVAYINSKRTFIPVNCRIVKQLSDFNGAWTTWDSGLIEDLSREVYDAFSRDVTSDARSRKRRFKKVGIWTLQLAAQALFIGLAGNIA